jgi:shikimate dehydrogenase
MREWPGICIEPIDPAGTRCGCGSLLSASRMHSEHAMTQAFRVVDVAAARIAVPARVNGRMENGMTSIDYADATSRQVRQPVPDDAAVVIRGTTRLFPVVGYPVHQVKAPRLYNDYFGRMRLDCAVVPIEIAPEDYAAVLPALLRVRNVGGVMVTIPHKVPTVGLLDDCSLAVKVSGSCNAVIRRRDGSLYGDMFDGRGFVRAAERGGFVTRGARCLVVGAGGAGAAIAAALADAGAAAVRLFDTRSQHTEELVAMLQPHFPGCVIETGPNRLAGFDLVVNATPLGMNPADSLPVASGEISPAMTIGEIVMKVEVTPLVAAARAKGCRTVLGYEMLTQQMDLYLEFLGLANAAAPA